AALRRALGSVMGRVPGPWSTVIRPVKALLSLLKVRMPAPSLVSWAPVLPLRWPLMVRLAPWFTVKNCWLLGALFSVMSNEMETLAAKALTKMVPLLGAEGLPRARALPARL